MPDTTGTIWGLPNYAGELFTASSLNTPLLTMTGGLTSGKQTSDQEFVTSSEYELPSAAQPAITEDASISGAVAANVTRAQVKNVCQIHHEAVLVSYAKSANRGRLSGVNTAGQQNNVVSEKDFQIARKLEKIARDVEYSMVQGVWAGMVNAATAVKTRGMVAACQLSGGTNVNASGGALTDTLIDSLLLGMFNAGAPFQNVVLYVNGTYKQKLSKIYGYAPEDRNVGGLDIKQLETDFGVVGVVTSMFAPANTVLALEASAIAPVFQEVPGKGVLFYEELAKTGAAEKGQIYGMIGVDHGPAFAHGRLYGLA